MITPLLKDVSLFMIGLLFAMGLGLSGMVNPAKVIGFLDVTGAWDPDLALVMMGALAVNIPATMFFKKRARPMLTTHFSLPTKTDLEPRLIIGAALFGAGWGLAGICPGPALVAFAGGASGLPAFILAMTFGMMATPVLDKGFSRLQRSRIPAQVQI